LMWVHKITQNYLIKEVEFLGLVSMIRLINKQKTFLIKPPLWI